MIELEIYDGDTQYILAGWGGAQWGSIYGENGGGFTYFRFNLPLKIGYDYPWLDFGFRLKARKYLSTILFDGQIRRIEESSGDRDRIVVTALGEIVVSEDDEFLRAFCDTRLNLWKPPSEIPTTIFRPDLYSFGTNALGLFMHANNNQEIESGWYTDLIYKFYDGETAERFKCDLSLVLGSGAIFDAAISEAPFSGKINTVDDGTDTITYKDDSGENTVLNGDTLTNTTRGASATVDTVNTGTNTITFSGSPDLSAWQADDSIEIDEARILYTGDAGEAYIEAGMVLWDLTQGKQAEIESVDTTNNFIVATSKTLISGWAADDEIFVAGPVFRATISSIAGTVITYSTFIGQDNIVNNWPLVNITKKGIALVSSHNDVTPSVTVGTASDIADWEENDVIMQNTSLFYATVASVINDGDGTGKVVWNTGSTIGLRLVSAIGASGSRITGWVLYNQTRDEYATVEQWDLGNEHIWVDTWSDIQNWVAGNVIRIYTPLKLAVYDSADNRIWPASDEREGAVPHIRTAIDVTKTGDGSTPQFKIRLSTIVSGTFDESSFALLENLKVYSTQSAVTTEFLAQQALALLDDSGHDWDSDTGEIESITEVLEPMFFEYQTPREAMQWACEFGDGSGNRLAWGIRLDDRKRFYLETQDLDRVDYLVRRTGPSDVSVAGDVQSSWQQIRGSYQDALGEQQLTAWRSNSDYYFNAKFRRKTITLDSIDNNADAVALVDQFLSENRIPKRSGSYTASEGSVFTPFGVPVPIDELKARGGIVRIEDWRAVEAGVSDTDLRNRWTTFQLVGVEIDYDSRRVTLVPASPKSSFETMMAELARLAIR